MAKNPLWALYFSKKMAEWQLALAFIPETILVNSMEKYINNPNSAMSDSGITKYFYDEAFFKSIKNQYGEKAIMGLCRATGDDILEELRPYTSNRKIKIIYDYLSRNKTKLNGIVENIKKNFLNRKV